MIHVFLIDLPIFHFHAFDHLTLYVIHSFDQATLGFVSISKGFRQGQN
jgi:hypothetical protein